MHIYGPSHITLRGQPAKLYVLKNDGYCWGRIDAGGESFDVSSGDDDLYELPDADAMDVFEELAKDEANISPVLRQL